MVEKEKRLGNQDPTQLAILPFRDGTVSGTPPTPFSRLAGLCFVFQQNLLSANGKMFGR